MQAVFIDVREPEEFNSGHVESALNFPLSSLELDLAKITKLGKDSELVIYCASGNRSGQAINFLNENGFTNLSNGINKQHIESESPQ